MISPANMCLLMGDHILQAFSLHAERKIYPRFDKSEHKGGVNLFALENIVPQENRRGELSP